MNDLKRLRPLCEAQLRRLTIPDPFEIREFCAAVAELRGRRVQLLPLPVPAGDTCPYGVWIATDTTDFVFHEQDTSPLHRDQIVLHEIAHMLLGHCADAVLEEETLALALPDLDPVMVQQVLRRHAYSTEDEKHAEMLASLILERSRRPAADTNAVIARLGEALRHPRRRQL